MCPNTAQVFRLGLDGAVCKAGAEPRRLLSLLHLEPGPSPNQPGPTSGKPGTLRLDFRRRCLQLRGHRHGSQDLGRPLWWALGCEALLHIQAPTTCRFVTLQPSEFITLFLISNPAVLSISEQEVHCSQEQQAPQSIFPGTRRARLRPRCTSLRAAVLVLWEARLDKSWVAGDPEEAVGRRREEQGPE